ncbi:MAG: serine/threonine protein kinase, partial [Planctomycetota bacterium]
MDMANQDQQPAEDEASVAFSDYLRRREQDPETEFDEFCRLRPNLTGQLQKLRDDWERATELFHKFGGAPTLTDRLKSTFGERIDLDISLEDDEEDSSSSSSRVMQRLAKPGGLSKNYRSKNLVARDGMGAILSVWDEDLRRTLAMKIVLGRDEEASDEGTPQVGENQLVRFLEEAQITGQLDHPGILPVHDLGIDENGRVYFTMPLIKGQTLKEILKFAREESHGWNITRVLNVLIKVCEAMAFAHSKAVIHRDLKPANIMVGRFGETYVMDWGLAKVLGRKEKRKATTPDEPDTSMSLVKTDRRDDAASDPDSPLITMDGDVVGTPTYMSPEQARGHLSELGPASDVYAVGAMLYQLLCGRAPFHEPDTRVSLHTVLARLLDGPPKPIDEIDKHVVPELTAICEKAMARNPEDRYEGMLELADDIRAFVEGHVVRAYESGAIAEFRKWVRRNRMAALSIATSVILVIGALLTFIVQQDRSRTKLEQQYEELGVANKKIEAERDRAEAQEREAERQRLRAESMVEVTRRQSYLGSIRAADSSLKLLDTTATLEMLATCEEDLRGWEWQYLSNLSSAQSIKFHLPDGLSSARVIGNGVHVLCCTADRRLILWNPDLNEIVAGFSDSKVSNSPPAFAVASPDGSKIYSLNVGGRLWIWDSTSGALLDNIYAHRPYVVFALEQSPDGSRLATAGQDSVVFLWDTDGMEVVASYPYEKRATSLAFRPDGMALAIGYSNGNIIVWPTTGEFALAPGNKGERRPLLEMQAHEKAITSLS